MRTALFIPTRAAAAFFHKKLPPDLQTDLASALEKAETWARKEYAPALAKRDKLSESERQTILAQLARFTGLDASLIDRQTLIVARQQFAEHTPTPQTQKPGFRTRLLRRVPIGLRFLSPSAAGCRPTASCAHLRPSLPPDASIPRQDAYKNISAA
jgi:hypothetical protein